MTQSRALQLRVLPTDSLIVSGLTLLGIAAFLVVAFNGAFELALLALGGVLALAALAFGAVAALRRKGWRVWTTSIALALIGAGLLIHEFIPAGDILHGGAAILTFALGVFQLQQGVRDRRRAT